MLIGPDLILGARERAPQVSLSVVEGMSHVLVESLQRGELDYALCYDVPQAPQWVRTALLQEDLMHVALRGAHSDQPIALVDVLDEVLAMPDTADTVRQAVLRAATDLGLELKVSYELRSIAAMKALALRGIASCVLPMASVADEVRSGHLCARRIVMPPVRRILYLARDARRAEPQNDTSLTAVVQEALMPLLSLLGTLGHPLWTRTA